MDTERRCPSCKKLLPTNAPQGMCPECLMKAGFGTGTAPAPGEPIRSPGFVPPTVAEVAKLFPQLEVLELLGQGGMGAVYKARQPALDRLVALKVLPPQTTRDAGFAERFTREARALARLNHPNIVGVYEFGQAGDLHYFMMEYVEGPNLRQVEKSGRLSSREALKIIPQICDALQFAHDEGIVHRDIKPENVMLDKKGRVKITDFGLAKIVGREPEALRLTGAKDVMGTPHYMAPEQVEHPQEVDHRADIFSLGVVFYELLTGELPLGKFQPPSKKVEVDVRLDEVVLHALEKEPERRYQHASQVKNDLDTIAAHPTAPPAAKAAKPDHFWRWFAAVVLALVALPVMLSVLSILAAMIIPACSRMRAHRPRPPQQESEAVPSATFATAKDVLTQNQVFDLLPDGRIHFRATTEAWNNSPEPWTTDQFMNSDFVSITNITDARNRPLTWETTHEGGTFHYSLTLHEPVAPGERLAITTEGIMTGQIRPTGAPGVFEYAMRHWPSAEGRTRRIELHRLPPGAKLLDKDPGDLHERTRDGHTELFIDRLIPPGDSLEVIYHYRLEGSDGIPARPEPESK